MSDAIIVGLIAAVPATVAAFASWRSHQSISALKIEINGRMAQLLQSVKIENQALGRAEGVEQERGRAEDRGRE